MRPSRFVTLCFVYSGALLLATQAAIYTPDLVLAVAGNSVAALCILFTGAYRLYSDESEQTPDEYGLFAYAMAFFSLLITLLFLAALFTF